MSGIPTYGYGRGASGSIATYGYARRSLVDILGAVRIFVRACVPTRMFRRSC